MEKSIQQLFDQYEEKSLEVEAAKRAMDAAEVPDLSKEEYITSDQADEHLIACMERERKEKELETLSQEWSEIQDALADKLCKINTKVLVKDRRDECTVLIHCEGGGIVVQDKE
ncbi:hypothetical protein [Pedobacter sp. GR22-10]|uniref:hypothetical protein n=1 Tax=Pedobacter TaxID=84567 RepID=UPI002246709A|nr:hypothetical protein [Pedobacter sp. GR22-10]MCX2431849.1 hypothetical protein [Pedobacter sp. GR22-10]